MNALLFNITEKKSRIALSDNRIKMIFSHRYRRLCYNRAILYGYPFNIHGGLSEICVDIGTLALAHKFVQ